MLLSLFGDEHICILFVRHQALVCVDSPLARDNILGLFLCNLLSACVCVRACLIESCVVAPIKPSSGGGSWVGGFELLGIEAGLDAILVLLLYEMS